MTSLNIAVIVASTRTQRFADNVLAWLNERLPARESNYSIVDLREHQLPYYDLQVPPSMAPRAYSSDGERELGEIFDAADGFIIIANEFNHGYSAALKNVLDHYQVEFHRKPVAYIGYGNVGGSRAIEQLRQVAAEQEMTTIRHAVHIMGPAVLAIRGGANPVETIAEYDPRLTMLLDDLDWWANALHLAREAQPQ